jgi:cytochrome oxidase Cu insertion factor (SCO1/SenC/PrrC family)
MKLPTIAALGLALGLAAAPMAAADPVPTAANEVHPLLVGAEIPTVDVQDIDGKTIDLAKLVKSKAAVLIFYRGGW